MSEPYYSDEWVTIWHGDCREQVLAAPIHAIITDPPYGTGLYPTDTDALSGDLLAAWIAQSPTAVFGWPERLVALCAAAKAVPDEWVTWWPTNGACRGFNPSGLWREAECIAVFGSGRWTELRRTRGEKASAIAANPALHNSTNRRVGLNRDEETRMGDVWREPAPGLAFNSHQRLHPNQKPIGIMLRLIEAMSAPGQTVLDPFMGSGTTLLAARARQRKAVGIEVDEAFCEVAAKRLSQGVLDLGGVA